MCIRDSSYRDKIHEPNISNISLHSPRESMCKISFDAIQPLLFCVNISIQFYLRAAGNSFGPILTLGGSNDVLSPTKMLFEVSVIKRNIQRLHAKNILDMNRRFQTKVAKC